MVRAGIATLIVALLGLIASALFWPREEESTTPDIGAFEAAHDPATTIDIASTYSGREALVDPHEVLPTWHRHARVEAAAVFEATRSCPPRTLETPPADVGLAKAYAWYAQTCAGGAPSNELLAAPPFMHPSGRSYGALAHAKDPRLLHVLELQDGELAELGSREWLALIRGERFVLTRSHLVTSTSGPLGLSRLRFYDRDAWESTGSPRRWQKPVTAALGATAIISTVAIALAFVRERRQATRDRVHVVRALTHELRTPVMALGLDIEPLRAAFDEIPSHLQGSLLRISAGIARLHRVIHHSARTLELVEGKGKLASPIAIESAHEMIRDLAAEWPSPESITLVFDGDDGSMTSDPEQIAVALRNLVENAYRHGKPPITVRARLDDRTLIVRVEDGGSFARKAKSAGLGLGLVLVERIARALGGSLRREAQPTAFVLRIARKGNGDR